MLHCDVLALIVTCFVCVESNVPRCICKLAERCMAVVWEHAENTVLTWMRFDNACDKFTPHTASSNNLLRVGLKRAWVQGSVYCRE